VSPNELVRNVPPFCRYIRSYPGDGLRSILDDSLANFLAVPVWSDERYLGSELQGYESSPPRSFDLCKYIYQAMHRLLRFIPTRPQRSPCPDWIRDILRLSIFPITKPDQSHWRGAIHNRIFVPDSASLNETLSKKVPLLDFRGEDVMKLIPLFRWANMPLKYISSYDDEKYIEIGQESVHTEAMGLLNRSERYVARYASFLKIVQLILS